MRAYLRLLRGRPKFRTLVLAEVVSLFGDWFTLVAVSLLTGGAAHGLLLLSLTLVAHTLPQALLGPFTGPLADFVDRRAALVATAIGQSTVTLVMVAASVGGFVDFIPLLVLLRGVLGAMREPAMSATLPSLVEPDELVRANALLASVWSTTYAIGMAVGGLVAGISPSLAIGIDAASFAVAALLLLGLPELGAAATHRPRELSTRSLLRGMRDAFKIAIQAPALGRAIFQKTPLAFGTGAAWMILVATAMRHPFIGTVGLTIGVLQGIRGVATGIGPVVAERAIAGGARPRRVDRFVIAGTFAAMVGFIWGAVPAVWVLSAWVWGMGIGANWVLTTSEVQRLGPKGFLGRLSAIDTLSWSLGMSISAVAVGALGKHAELAALVCIGVGVVLDVALAAWTSDRTAAVSRSGAL